MENHAVAEERYFYAPLIKFERTIGHSRHGIAEHHVIDKRIAELDQLEMSDPNWLKVMKKLQDKVLHHLEEEREFFQQAGVVLTDKQKIGILAEINDFDTEVDYASLSLQYTF